MSIKARLLLYNTHKQFFVVILGRVLIKQDSLVVLSLGELVLVATEKKGLGGAMKFLFKCNGCWVEEIPFLSSQLAAESRRHIMSLAPSLAFFISGQGYASYRKTLGKGLGLGVVSKKPDLQIVGLALPHIKQIFDDMCEDTKTQMCNISDDTLENWGRSVTTCDGCWQIRGHFSQTCTFIIKNYLTGALLYYEHLSMRGADNISTEELWQGTLKGSLGSDFMGQGQGRGY